MTSETQVQLKIADFLCLQYPEVLFHSDFGSGVKLQPWQSRLQKELNGGRRGWSDMVIAQPRWWHRTCDLPYFVKDKYDRYGSLYFGESDTGLAHQAHGLYIELKKDGETLYPGSRAKKRFKSLDGKEYRLEHFMEQADVLYELRQCGYCAEFAIGFDEAMKIIKAYLGEPHREKVEF